MHRSLLTHCRSILAKHHALAKGGYKQGATAVHDSGLDGLEGNEFDHLEPNMADPLVVDEDEILEEFWKENEVIYSCIHI
jgi:hypothetical protein